MRFCYNHLVNKAELPVLTCSHSVQYGQYVFAKYDFADSWCLSWVQTGKVCTHFYFLLRALEVLYH